MMSCPTSVLLLLITGVLCNKVTRSDVYCTSISKLPDLEKAVAEIGDWESLCENLGVTHSVMAELQFKAIENAGKKHRCLEAYLYSGKACWESVVSVVADHPFYNKRLAKKIAQQYQVGLDAVRQIYERELRYGFILTSIAKILLFGNAGSGKTSVTAVMTGDPPPQIRSSTPLMVRPVQVITVRIEELMEWKKKKPEEVQRIIAEIIRSRELQETVLPNDEQAQTLIEELQFPTLPQSSLKGNSEFDSLLESVASKDGFLSMVINSSPPPHPVLEQKWLYIIDSGGQPEFHNMLSIFVQKATTCIYVFKIHEELDHHPLIDFFDDTGRSVSLPRYSRLTNRQIFQQFMHTMRSFSSEKNGDPPRIVLLATHRDLVKESTLPKILEERHKQLKAIVMPQFKKQLIYLDEKFEKFIFTMNAKQPEERDIHTANELRKVITGKSPWEKVKIPLRWHILDYRSRKISEGLKRKVLSREEYEKIAETLNMNKSSCDGALNFFNSLNTIFYFPKALPELVFLDPQILLNKLSELVVNRYQKNQDCKSDQSGCVQAKMPKEHHFQFHDFAEVTDELLQEFAEDYYPPLFTSRELIILFEKLLIFGKLREGVWFVPSILPYTKKEEVEQYRVSKERSLLINFPDGGPQNGIFCSTVSFLLSNDNTSPCPWKVLMNTDKPVCLTRNVVLFTVRDFPGEVALIEEWTHFEIHVRTDEDMEKDLWQLVYKAVFNGLAKAAETHHYSYSDNAPQPAIRCPEQHDNHPSTPHPATINHQGKWKWKCTKSKQWFGHVNNTRTFPWLNLLTTQQPPYHSKVTKWEEQEQYQRETDDRWTPLITSMIVVIFGVVVFALFRIGLWRSSGQRQTGVSDGDDSVEPTNMYNESLLPPCPVNVNVESHARSFSVEWDQLPQDSDHRIVHRVQYKHESDDWPVNSQDSRWREVKAGRNKIEITGLHPNKKYDVKVLAKYAIAEDIIENWSEKEVTTETKKTLSQWIFQWIQENPLALPGLVVTVVASIIIPLVTTSLTCGQT